MTQPPNSEHAPYANESKEPLSAEGAERFMPLAKMERLVARTLESRVSFDDTLKPLTEKRFTFKDPHNRVQPHEETIVHHDFVFPPFGDEAVRNSDGSVSVSEWDFDPSVMIDVTLYGNDYVPVDQEDVEQDTRSNVHLRETAQAAGLKVDDEDLEHLAYFRLTPEGTDPHDLRGSDLVAPLQIHVPSGLRSADIAQRIVEAGAKFSTMEVHPVLGVKEGMAFVDSHGVVVEVNRSDQLYSVLHVLHQLEKDGKLPEDIESPPIGMDVEGLPGVFIGQEITISKMTDRSGPLLTQGILEAADEVREIVPVVAGQKIPEGWLTEVATRARKKAQMRATASDVSLSNHALVHNQDPGVVDKAIEAAGV